MILVGKSWQRSLTLNRDVDVESVGSSSPTPSDSVSDHEIEYEHSEPIGVVNQCLVDLGEAPVTKRKLQSKKHKERKLEVLALKMSEVLLSKK